MVLIIVLFHLVLNFTDLIDLLWLEDPVFFLLLADSIVDDITAFFVLAGLSLGSNCHNIIKCKDNRVIIIIVSVFFYLLG